MDAKEFKRQLKRLLDDVDSRVAADVLLEAAKSQYLLYASEAENAGYKQGYDLGARGVEPF